MRKISLILILLFITSGANAQNTKYAASFLDLGVGARALGMGSAYVGLSNDAYGFYWNPAGLAFITNLQAASMYADLFNALEKQSYMSAAMPIFGGSAVSVAWIRLSIDDIPRYLYDDSHTPRQRYDDSNIQLIGGPEGYFGNYNDAFVISFAKYVRWNIDLGWQYFELPIDIGGGLNFKIIRQALDDKTGSGLGIDAGIMARLNLNDVFVEDLYGDFIFGINVQDIANTKISWDTGSKHKDQIDRNFKYGISYSQPLSFINSQLTVAYDINSKYDGSTHLGGEFLYNSMLAVRIGANSGFFTTGAGVYFWKFKFDYAYQGHDLGNSHRVSVLFGF